MREAELKHGRVSMLAVLGWVVVDSGLRMPGSGYESIANSFAAHDAAVANGSMVNKIFICIYICIYESVYQEKNCIMCVYSYIYNCDMNQYLLLLLMDKWYV
jgi:hypothetical protein